MIAINIRIMSSGTALSPSGISNFDRLMMILMLNKRIRGTEKIFPMIWNEIENSFLLCFLNYKDF